MPFFEMLPGGMPAGLQSDMDAVLNKKLGTSTSYPPEDWPENVNLMGPLEEKTVSGSVVTFSDGADDVPLKSCAVTIAPNLDGVSSVDVVQTGKNLLDTAISETKTNNSVSVICDGNGKYTATGTATGGSANITFMLKTPCKIKSGMYFHAMNSVVNGNASITLQRQDNSTIMYFTLSPTNRIVDLSSYAGETVYSIRFYVVNGTSFEMSLTPMVCFSSTATTYEPYIEPKTYSANLGRTIYGGEVDVVNGTGTDENGNDFTFTPVPINSRLGDNTMWGDGDLSVVYRSSGTQTLIPPTLISKTITENGTYSAEDDNADGYDEVTVNVPTGTTDPFKVLSINGTAGTETFTADKAGTYMFLVGTSAQGTASITSAVTPDLTFSKQSSDNRGLVGAIYTLGVGDTVTMSNTVVSWVYNTKVVLEMNISVSAVIDSTIVSDGTITSFSPSITGNALFISMAGGRSNDNSYDRTYTDLNSFEFFGKVETGIFLRIRYGSTVPSYQLYGFDGGCALAIVLQ